MKLRCMVSHPYAHSLALAALYNRHCTASTTARALGFPVAWSPWRADWDLIPLLSQGPGVVMSWPWDRPFSYD